MFDVASNIVDSSLIEVFRFGNKNCLLLTLLAGISIPLALESEGLETMLGRFITITAGTAFTIGPLGYWVIPKIFNLWFASKYPSGTYNNFYYPDVSAWQVILLFAITCTTFFFLRRFISPALNVFRHKITKRSELERNKRTDIRNIDLVLPKTFRDYDAFKHINLQKGVFVGLNEKGKPNYIPLEKYQESHVQAIGTSGAGKGVISTILLAQSVIAGEAVFVVDPKDDAWCSHVLKYICEKHNKQFHLINLNSDQYQLDFLSRMTPLELEELLIAGFSLAEKGEASDFYRIEDRRAARVLSQTLKDGDTLRSIFNSGFAQGLKKQAPGFFGKLEELALMNSINAVGGLDISKVIDNGGCVYITGSMRNSRIIMMQRMLMVRFIQMAERRDRVAGKLLPVAVFLDEFKYHISKTALEGLGAARDKGVHIIMAHQSLADLHDCPADINGDAVQGAVVENTNIKFVYRLKDPETAEWMAKMSGTILADDEIRKIKQNSSLAEVVDSERTIKQAERYLVDVNMLLSLPTSTAFMYSDKTPKSLFIRRIKAPKSPLEIYKAPFIKSASFDPLAGLDEAPEISYEEMPDFNYDEMTDTPPIDDLEAFK